MSLLKAKHSPYEIDLFEGWRQWSFVLVLLILLFGVKMAFIWQDYKKLPIDSAGEITAKVLLQYQKEKNNKPYTVMKLDSNGYIFYITSKEDLKHLVGRYIRVYGKTSCSFVEFLRSCFFIAFTFSLMPKRDIAQPLKSYINLQHENPKNASLFRTLFLGDALDKDWRNVSNLLGLAHILAISGFHLGVLSSFLFLVLTPIYRIFQRRFFSWRNEFYDVGLIVIVFMFGYLILLDFLPSFLRAFVMALFGFLLYFWGLRIVNFKLLGLVGLSCIALFPQALLNIGFILSMSGVFYIFLFVRYFPKTNLLIYWSCFNIVIFFSITPIVHYFFPYFSPYQLVSIPVSLAFVVYFPMMLILHFIGFGGVFDIVLDKTLTLEIPSIDFYLPLSYTLVYVGLSLGAMFSRKIYIVMFICSLGFYGFLCARFISS